MLARFPIGLLRCDCRADRVFVAHVVERQFEVDCGQSALLAQRFADSHPTFSVRRKLGPHIGDRLVIGEEAARYGDGRSHAGETLGQRIDERSCPVVPTLGARLFLPATLEVDHLLAAMVDRAGSSQCGTRLDRRCKCLDHGFETGCDMADDTRLYARKSVGDGLQG